jgi:S1-C subfamily serine protease
MGLQNGDVVTAVNDKTVKNIGEFYRYIADSSVKEVWFDVLREGQTVSTMRYKK